MADTPRTDGAPAPTPDQEVRRLYEEAESRVAKAAERVVSRDSFGELLAMMTENVGGGPGSSAAWGAGARNGLI